MASVAEVMQYIMPLFALSGLYWQFGLVLYWVTTNLWTLGQQYVLFKRFPPPGRSARLWCCGAAGAAAARSRGKQPGGKQSGSASPRTPT